MKPFFKDIDCISLKVSNLDSAISFYQNSLGHTLNWKGENSAGLALPQSKTELVLHTEDRPMEVDFLVDSVPMAVEEFKKSGGVVEVEPFEIQIGLCAVLKDPWGNQLVILDHSKGLLKVDKNKNVIG